MKLLTPEQLKKLKKGTKVKDINGNILTIGKNKVYADDIRFGMTPYGIYKPSKKSKK